jgi:MFS family permease
VGRLVLAGSILFPAPIAVMALASGPHWREVAIISVGEALSSAGVMMFDINLNAVQTAVTAEHMRSRMAGVFSTINYGARPLGSVTGGVLAGWLGVRPTLFVAATGATLCCLWLLRSPIPGIRSVDALPPAASALPDPPASTEPIDVSRVLADNEAWPPH